MSQIWVQILFWFFSTSNGIVCIQGPSMPNDNWLPLILDIDKIIYNIVYVLK